MTDRLETMRAMAAKQPNNPLARFGYANELLKGGLFVDAETELAAYLALHDDEGNGWLRYGDVLKMLDRETEARVAIANGIVAATRFGHGTLVGEMESRIDEWNDV